MAITINHTGRRKLDGSEYKISLVRDSEGLNSFRFDLNLKPSKTLSESRIFVEANCGNVMQRFDFGTVDNVRPPQSTVLDKLDSTPKFTVLLVDQQRHMGRIQARATSRALGGDDESAASLLVLTTWDLGEVVWSIKMNQGDRPELCINQNIPDALQLIRARPEYQAMILPAAFKEIMGNYFAMDNRDEDDLCQNQWWELAESLGGALNENSSFDEYLRWIDGVISQFCSEHMFCSDFLKLLEVMDE